MSPRAGVFRIRWLGGGMRYSALLLTLMMSVLASDRAHAQELDMPRLEFGGIASGFVIAAAGDGLALVGGGPTVTIGLPRRIRLDLRTELLGPSEQSGFSGLYGAQVRFPLRVAPDGARALAVSAGLGGLFSYYRRREFRSTRPDGSIVVYPGYRDLRASAPRIATVGVTYQRIVSRRASAIFEAGALIGQGAVVGRASAGVAFGARRYR
jgi:hypothetical protein